MVGAWRSLFEKTHAATIDLQAAFFQERADGLFEGAFANAQFGVDFGGAAVIAERPESAAGSEFGEDAFFQTEHLGTTRGMKRKVYFPVFADGGDVALGVFPGLERLEYPIGK